MFGRMFCWWYFRIFHRGFAIVMVLSFLNNKKKKHWFVALFKMEKNTDLGCAPSVALQNQTVPRTVIGVNGFPIAIPYAVLNCLVMPTQTLQCVCTRWCACIPIVSPFNRTLGCQWKMDTERIYSLVQKNKKNRSYSFELMWYKWKTGIDEDKGTYFGTLPNADNFRFKPLLVYSSFKTGVDLIILNVAWPVLYPFKEHFCP